MVISFSFSFHFFLLLAVSGNQKRQFLLVISTKNAYIGSSVPACSAAMHAAYPPGQFAPRCPLLHALTL
jgi:hypothetical protein